MGNRAITGGRGQNKHKVKGNIMKQLLALICGAILIVAYAQAQSDTTSSPTTSSPATSSMTSPATTSMTNTGSSRSNSGTVTDYTPQSGDHDRPGHGQAGALRYWREGPSGRARWQSDRQR